MWIPLCKMMIAHSEGKVLFLFAQIWAGYERIYQFRLVINIYIDKVCLQV